MVRNFKFLLQSSVNYSHGPTESITIYVSKKENGGRKSGESPGPAVLDFETLKTYNFTMFKSFEGVISPGSAEYGLIQKIDKKKIPAHIAVIMDGNGRWAQSRGLKRTDGHQAGSESARKVTEYCVRLNIKHLTLFTFSSENWKRPAREVNTLMNMLQKNLLTQRDLLAEHNIRFGVQGELDRLPQHLRSSISETINFSKGHTGLSLHLALNYGGRAEIVHAVRRMIRENVKAAEINEESFRNYLYDGSIPDPDLIIRTSGEFRLSNFLLYQAAYSELFFSDALWPDFGLKHLLEAILDYQNRKRRFGKA